MEEIQIAKIQTDYGYISENIDEIFANMEAAQKTSEFSNPNPKLLAVTKTLESKIIANAINPKVAGFAENKVQELLEKVEQMPEVENWHFIGHLQSNKVRQIVDKVALIHSLDSLSLAKEIDKRGKAIDRVIPCLVQVNMGEEDSKFGLEAQDVWNFLVEMEKYPNISIEGFMTVAPYAPAEEVRPVFRKMRELLIECRTKAKNANHKNQPLTELSMGMSNDYQVAIEEGATLIRVGSDIFGARIYR